MLSPSESIFCDIAMMQFLCYLYFAKFLGGGIQVNSTMATQACNSGNIGLRRVPMPLQNSFPAKQKRRDGARLRPGSTTLNSRLPVDHSAQGSCLQSH